MLKISSIFLLGGAIALPISAAADVQIISEQAKVSLFVEADGETDSIGHNVAAGETPPFFESLSLSNSETTVQAGASASLSEYAVSTSSGLSLSAAGAASVSTEVSQSRATASGFSGLTLRFDIDHPANYSAAGSLVKANLSELGVDESLVYAQLARINPQSGQFEGIWTTVASSGTLPFNHSGVLAGNSQYVLTVSAQGWVQSVWPDTLTANNSGSFDIDLNLLEVDPGDTDYDGDVDLNDLSSLASNYGNTGMPGWSHGNFDFDNDVDLNDLSLLASYYGTGQAQAIADFANLTAVPEPSFALALPLACLFVRRPNRKADYSPMTIR